MLTLEDTLRVVASRAKMMTDNCVANESGMLACKLSPEGAQKLISQSPNASQLTVTCLNGIDDCVVGGPLDQIDLFQKECKIHKVKVKPMDVPYAFHSSAMDPILEPLQTLGHSVQFARPSIPVYSNVFGRLFEEKDFSSDYFALHARQPVRFTEGLLDLQSRDLLENTVFIEIGPHPTLLPILRGSSQSESCTYLGCLHKGQDAWISIGSMLATLSLLKLSMNWRDVFIGTSAKVTSLPGHPLGGSSYMIPYREPGLVVDSPEHSSGELRTKTKFSLLPWLKSQKSSSKGFVLETALSVLGPLISGHNVGGNCICPASVFQELALEGAQTILKPPEEELLVVTGMSFVSPLIYVPSRDADIVTVHIFRHDSTSAVDFKVTSCLTKDLEENTHCTGRVSLQNFRSNSCHWVKDAAMVTRQSRYFSGSGKNYLSTFRGKVLYDSVFARVVRYAPEYQSLVYLSVAESNLEGIGSFKIPSSSQNDYLAHPVFTDTLLHAAGFIANLAVRSDEASICANVESVEISYLDIDYADSFTVYCSLLEIKGAFLADATALNAAGEVVAVVRGMEFKRLRRSTFQQALSRQSFAIDPGKFPVEQDEPELSAGLDGSLTSEDAIKSPVESRGSLVSEVGKTLRTIVTEVGGFSEQDLDYTKSLDELGIDSLMQIEIISKVTRTFPGQTGLDHRALSECETLESLERTIGSILQVPVEVTPPNSTLVSSRQQDSRQLTPIDSDCPSSDERQNNPMTLHVSHAEAASLCLFHDGSGQVSMYARLRDHDRSMTAFFDPHFGSPTRPPTSIEQVTEYYVSLLPRSKLSPLIVGGKSGFCPLLNLADNNQVGRSGE